MARTANGLRATAAMLERLYEVGIGVDDALALRRISMTLHRWHELECGNDRGCISRDETSDRPFWESSDGIERKYKNWLPDREKGALKRLAKIMAKYPALESYVQGDPRGCALYILRPGDIPEGATLDSCYNRGIAVHA